MDSFFNFFVKQKKLALVFTVSIIAIGLLAFNNIQRDQFPAIDFELVTIVTGYPGASPEDVEQNITNPIEDELSSVIGIEKFSSISRQGSSVILVTLSPDVDDVKTSASFFCLTKKLKKLSIRLGRLIIYYALFCVPFHLISAYEYECYLVLLPPIHRHQ
jgi:multidrug efflux pump subunit AcrB